MHRFLWRNLETDRPPDIYAMNVFTFGDKPAPVMAQIALQKTAEEGESINPEAARTIKDSTYMDDILDSVNTKEEARKLTSDVDRILEKGGFKVKGWRSNKDLNDRNTETNEIRVPQGQTEAKVLGVSWNCEEDVLKYKFEIEAMKPCLTDLTKRKILSCLVLNWSSACVAFSQSGSVWICSCQSQQVCKLFLRCEKPPQFVQNL